jgi:hypothetical protein
MAITIWRGSKNATSLNCIKINLKHSIIANDLSICYIAYADLVKILIAGKSKEKRF